MYDNPENLSPEDIIMKLRSLTHGCIMSSYHTENRSKRIETIESYGLPVKISKKEWINRFCK